MGALAIHTLAVVAFDVVIVYTPHPVPEIAPHVELVDLELPPPPKPPPKPPEPEPAPAKPPPQRLASTQPHRSIPAQPDRAPDPTPTPPPPATSTTAAGGREPYRLDEDAARDGVGQRGKPTTDRIGPGGTGGGTGSGSGSGSAAVEAVHPVSVATIKTPAKPRGDFAYFDDAKSYPAEAVQLGIEGAIKVQLVVDETGKIKRARLLTRLGHGLDELALQHANQLVFEPALDTDDRPVASVVVWTFHMTLPK